MKVLPRGRHLGCHRRNHSAGRTLRHRPGHRPRRGRRARQRPPHPRHHASRGGHPRPRRRQLPAHQRQRMAGRHHERQDAPDPVDPVLQQAAGAAAVLVRRGAHRIDHLQAHPIDHQCHRLRQGLLEQLLHPAADDVRRPHHFGHLLLAAGPAVGDRLPDLRLVDGLDVTQLADPSGRHQPPHRHRRRAVPRGRLADSRRQVLRHRGQRAETIQQPLRRHRRRHPPAVQPLAPHGHRAEGGPQRHLLRYLRHHLRPNRQGILRRRGHDPAHPAHDDGSPAGADDELHHRRRPARRGRVQGLLLRHGDPSGPRTADRHDDHPRARAGRPDDLLQRHRLQLRRHQSGHRPCHLRRQSRREGGTCGRIRGRKVHLGEPAARPLPGHRGRHHGGRQRYLSGDPGCLATPYRSGLPGSGTVLRIDPGEHRLRHRGHRRADPRRCSPRLRRPLHQAVLPAVRHPRRGARYQALRWPEAAHLDCQGPAQGRPDPRSRRGHLSPGHQVRAVGAGRSGIPHGRPHQPHHRPPPLDDLQRRPDRHPGRAGRLRRYLRRVVGPAGIQLEGRPQEAGAIRHQTVMRTAPTMAPTQPRHERRIVPTRFGPGRSGVTGSWIR
ncbi:ABC transporter, ATP-binding protein [Cutibacterium acnes P15]|nr:ABC transporter, ATP-binding protein [Cutibacterium acnes P15]